MNRAPSPAQGPGVTPDRSLAALAGVLILLCLAVCAPLAARAQEAPMAVPDGAVAGAPGTVIAQEPITGAPPGSLAYRFLYRSSGLAGETIVVSGMAVIPQGTPPAGGRAIVAWAHPTSGLVERCAPSLARQRFGLIPGL